MIQAAGHQDHEEGGETLVHAETGLTHPQHRGGGHHLGPNLLHIIMVTLNCYGHYHDHIIIVIIIITSSWPQVTPCDQPHTSYLHHVPPHSHQEPGCGPGPQELTNDVGGQRCHRYPTPYRHT